MDVHVGFFYIIGIFVCDSKNISIYNTLDIVHGSTINPPTGGSQPPPVTSNPNTSIGVCIPTTGSFSMGDINIILSRIRNLSNTLLSGGSNPSIAPSQFGLSFLPLSGSISKTTPNAISELRGYCHIQPVPDINLYYQFDSDEFGVGRMIISYVNTNGDIQTLTITHSDTSNIQSNNGNLLLKAGNLVDISVINDSFSISVTSLIAARNGGTVYNSGNTTNVSINYQIVLNTGDTTCQAFGVTNGNNPFG